MAKKTYSELEKEVETLKKKIQELVEIDCCPECRALVRAPWKESHEKWCETGKLLED